MSQKVVVCGAGFLGNAITRNLTRSPAIRVQLSGRTPQKSYEFLKTSVPHQRLLSPVTVDVRNIETLRHAFDDASLVVSLVGIMQGNPTDFEEIQWRGALNVAQAARDAGAKLVHISAIGADPDSNIPYVRTKGLGEISVLEEYPQATIVRPSLVFGPEDDFFNRFSRLSKFLPFLPVFGGGTSLFQPVFVEDIARLVNLIVSNPDAQVGLAGKIVEAGGPEVYTYKEIMQAVLKYNGRNRPIISLPFALGRIQGLVLEQLPLNLFTVTRAQVEQLKYNNIVNQNLPSNNVSLQDVLERYDADCPLRSIHDVLPTYLGEV